MIFAARANDAGGGPNGEGANVMLADNGSTVTQAGGTLALTIQGYDGHTSQMQRSPTLNSANWQNAGPAQDGLNAPLTFTDTLGGRKNFYRVFVAP